MSTTEEFPLTSQPQAVSNQLIGQIKKDIDRHFGLDYMSTQTLRTYFGDESKHGIVQICEGEVAGVSLLEVLNRNSAQHLPWFDDSLTG